MKKEQIIKINPRNFKMLKKMGYKKSRYYVGPWGFMNIITKLRDEFKQFNIKFPFNSHAFKHDLLYNKGGSLIWKLKVDFTFLTDMINTIYSDKKLKHLKTRLLIRALFFYLVVTLATPIYIKKGNWRLNKN